MSKKLVCFFGLVRKGGVVFGLVREGGIVYAPICQSIDEGVNVRPCKKLVIVQAWPLCLNIIIMFSITVVDFSYFIAQGEKVLLLTPVLG